MKHSPTMYQISKTYPHSNTLVFSFQIGLSSPSKMKTLKMERSSIIILIMLMILVLVLDTGQCQDVAVAANSPPPPPHDCRRISDGCSCPKTQPHYLRCIGKKDDLETILNHLQKIDYHINLLGKKEKKWIVCCWGEEELACCDSWSLHQMLLFLEWVTFSPRHH